MTHAPHHRLPRATACGRDPDRFTVTDPPPIAIADAADGVTCKKCIRVLASHPRRDPWRQPKQPRRE